jgi:hypothetical protein
VTSSPPIETDLQIDAQAPTFLEQWVAGTYLVTGIFPTDGRGLSVERMVQSIPAFYAQSRSHKRSAWPRGICGYFLVPIYTADAFDANVVEWVHSFHPYRWAIWHTPVLYHTADNGAEKRFYGDPRTDKYYWYGSAYVPYLEHVIAVALRSVARSFGYERPQRVNGTAF